MVEVETKARVDAGAMEELLTEIGAEFIERRLQTDAYYVPGSERSLVYRIRRTPEECFLTIKGVSVHEQGGAWPEWETPLEDPDALEELFLQGGYTHLLTVQKDESIFTLDDFTIQVDRIKELGEFVEIELISEAVDDAKRRISQLLSNRLGIPEKDFIYRGYLQMLLAKQTTAP